MNNETPTKLTANELPELANQDTSTEGTCCCYYRNTWTGWELIRCTGEFSSEDECSRNAPSGSDIGYTWKNSGC